MPRKRIFEAELAALNALRDLSPAAAAPEVAKALTSRNNLIVSKAATLALHHHLTSLVPNLVAAFPRFLENSAESDPQCWAKNALAKTLAACEYQEQEFFLTGMRHIQLESVWGGSEDTAGTLRGTCALALVQCRELDSHRLLVHLVPVLADKEPTVRVNVVRAIEQVGTDSAALLLRLLASWRPTPQRSSAPATPVFSRSKVPLRSIGPRGFWGEKMILRQKRPWRSPRPTSPRHFDCCKQPSVGRATVGSVLPFLPPLL